MADLTDADKADLTALLRDTIAADRFPLSPRVRRWKAILEAGAAGTEARTAAAAEAPGRAEHGCGKDARGEAAAVRINRKHESCCVKD